MSNKELEEFIEFLEKNIEKRRSYILACIGSPFFVTENYQNCLKLDGMIDALSMAKGFYISKRKND
jgi:hypothetical protein